MWEHFGKLVLHVKSGGSPDLKWLRHSYIAHSLLMDIHRSMLSGNSFIEIDWSHLKTALQVSVECGG